MLDDHIHPDNWGVYPTLFHVGGFEVSSYSFFVFLGLVVGIWLYVSESRRQKSLNEMSFFLAFGALAGGILGAKIFEWVIEYKYILAHLSHLEVLVSGRTIVGGLIGGVVGMFFTKRILKIRERKGNLFAPAVAMGVAIGRIGCFLQGCCYGTPTALFWGIDFGDGIMRHPTQLYESLFMVGMFLYLQQVKKGSDVRPGQLFKTLMVAYFTFRFFVEFIRVELIAFWGLTFFQIISLCVILFLLRNGLLGGVRDILNNKITSYGRKG